jgi:hypothetical protein
LDHIKFNLVNINGLGTKADIHFHQSLDNILMRNMVSQSSTQLVLSTGVMSTLELFQDKKLPYYQNLAINEYFIKSYLLAVKSICSSDDTLFGNMPQLIIELSDLLFRKKPLPPGDLKRTQDLLAMDSISMRLTEVNTRVIKKANGTLAGHLLNFIGGPTRTQAYRQCVTACLSLCKPGETLPPTFRQALRRAAAKDLIFELKVLIKYLSVSDINSADKNQTKYTALHWAAKSCNYDCAKTLIEAGADVDIQDGQGKTALHYALENNNNIMSQLLLAESRANINIADTTSNSTNLSLI